MRPFRHYGTDSGGKFGVITDKQIKGLLFAYPPVRSATPVPPPFLEDITMNRHYSTNPLVNARSFFIALSLMLVAGLASAAEVVNLNKADAAAFQQNLIGIGPIKAEAIVSYRSKNGKFGSIDDLQNVKGLGPALIKKNKRYLSLSKGLVKGDAKAYASAKKQAGSSKSGSSSKAKKKSSTTAAKSDDTSKASSKSESKSSSKDSKTAKKDKKKSKSATKSTAKSTDSSASTAKPAKKKKSTSKSKTSKSKSSKKKTTKKKSKKKKPCKKKDGTKCKPAA